MIGVMLAAMTGLLFMSMLDDGQPISTAETVITPNPSPSTAPTESAAPASPTPSNSNPAVEPTDNAPTSEATEFVTLAPTIAPPSPSPESGQTPPPTEAPTITPIPPTLEPSPTDEPVTAGWQRIQINTPAISFEVPADWLRLGEDLAWSSDAGRTEVGLRWQEIKADWHSSSMLEPPFQLVDSKAVNLGWSQGHSYLVQVLQDNNPAGVQRHIIVQSNADLAFDFYASAQNLRDLAVLEETLDQMLNSITLQVDPGDPVEVAVQFLGSMLRGEIGDEYLSQQLQTELENGRTTLSLLGVNDIFGSYYVYWLSVTEAGDMAVQVELNYADGRVIKRVFTLIKQSGNWRIDAIAPIG